MAKKEFIEYPKWKYCQGHEPRIVKSKEQDEALGLEWHESPAAVEKSPKKDETPGATSDEPVPNDEPNIKAPDQAPDNGESMNLPGRKREELLIIAKDLGLKGFQNLSKADLVELIEAEMEKE